MENRLGLKLGASISGLTPLMLSFGVGRYATDAAAARVAFNPRRIFPSVGPEPAGKMTLRNGLCPLLSGVIMTLYD